MAHHTRVLLLAPTLRDARAFAAHYRVAGHDSLVVVWHLAREEQDQATESSDVLPATAFGDPAELRSRSLDEADSVTRCVVESRWWEIEGVNIARILRDALVREISLHLRALLRVEAILDETKPSSILAPRPLKPSYYAADGMIVESARLAASKRGMALSMVGDSWRKARAALAELKWRAGLLLRQNYYLRQAALKPGPSSVSKKPPAASSTTICVGPSWGAELQSHQPISEALCRRGWSIVPFEVPSYYSRPDWRDDLLPERTVPVGEWGGNRAFVAAVRASEKLQERLADDTLRQQHRQVFEVLGINLLDSPYFRSRLTRLATVEARLAVAMYICGQRMCELLRPALVFSVKGEGPEVRGLMNATQDAGVPVVFMPHGLNADDPRWSDIQADLVLTYGDSFVQTLQHRTSGRIAAKAIGTPKYDAFFRERDTTDVDTARAEFGMAKRSLWIGVATTDKPERDRDNVAAAAAFARQHGDAAVLVKTHPRRSQPELVRAFRQAAGPGGVVLTKVDTMRALWCCDVVVTGVSSAAIEAMAAGRPVIYVGDPDEDIHGYVRERVCLAVEQPAELGEAISRLLAEKQTRQRLIARGLEFARYRLGPLDGHATQRAIAEIERLASGGTPPER